MVYIHISLTILNEGEVTGEIFEKRISLSEGLFKELSAHFELFKTLADHIEIIKEVKGE